ncbi:hypothetical protein SDC9_138683 [bioreactor metagenome]|jgi:hypothetical protein|uniref:Uncharacterized protein n=1 Tax=bioreactor metagenome TaxID=1076179 RepID=A0A645DSX3_9ZZZZ
METIIYKMEISETEAIIYTMTTKGDILGSEEMHPLFATHFAAKHGLSCMQDDGFVKCYW